MSYHVFVITFMGAKTFPVYWKEADLLDPSVRNVVTAPVYQFFISIRMFEEYIAAVRSGKISLQNNR